MKKLVIITITFLLVGYANSFSQSEKNDLKLTVSALPLYGSSGNFTSGINGLVLKPSVGYYISEKTSIELNFTYASMNNLKVGTIEGYYNSFAIVPVLRNNMLNKKKIRLFGEIGFGLGTIKYSPDNSAFQNSQFEDLSGGISVLTIGAGVNYYFTNKFGIELVIPYITTNNITSEKSNNLYSGIGPTLGVTFKMN
ncbi:hypothetical protein [Psychroserpens sp.]